MLRILGHQTLYRDPRFYAAFPALCTLPDGQVLVLFRRARDLRWFARTLGATAAAELGQVDHVDSRSHLALLRLTPDVAPATAEPVCLPADPEAGDQDANLLALPDGTLVVGSFHWYPVSTAAARTLQAAGATLIGSAETTGSRFLFWGASCRRSPDGGRNWSAPTFLPPVPGAPDIIPGVRACLGGALRGRGAVLPDGTLLQATYAHGPGGMASHLFRSADAGTSWTYAGRIAHDPEGRVGFVEPALLRTGAGRLIGFHRTFGLGDRLVVSVSEDEGASWTPWVVRDVVGHPFDALLLADGRALVVYGYRHPPYGIRARLFDPDRERIDEVPELILRDDGPGPDLGYPWATELADGTVLVAYYMADSDGIRHITATRVEVSG